MAEGVADVGVFDLVRAQGSGLGLRAQGLGLRAQGSGLRA